MQYGLAKKKRMIALHTYRGMSEHRHLVGQRVSMWNECEGVFAMQRTTQWFVLGTVSCALT